tara:strand:- start:5559 stop:6533 length:975 start_codon:yes stop_codon:yes gene_type:complete
MIELKSYIRKVTGVDVEELGYPADALQRLPLFIREGYDFLFGEIYDHQIVFVEPNAADDATPSQLQKHIPKIESAFEHPVVLVIDDMTYYLKEQLIKSRISFIVPGKQLFIPFMFMDLSEQPKIRTTRSEYFSPSTQCVLIYHLWVASLEGLNFQEIADLFDYTPRTIGRSAKELEDAGVCRIAGSKSKLLEFSLNKRDIWERALDYLVSPVKESKWLFSEPDDRRYYRIAGVSALSRYSNISPGRQKVYAMEAKTYRELKNKGEVTDTLFNEVDKQLQIWSYDPTLLTSDDFVDPLSLYLSLKDDPDERVQIEMEKMLEEVFK